MVGMSGILYRTLESTEIRLLAIEGLGRIDIVQCRLIQVQLTEQLSFTALSYCWGDTSVTKTILVDGRSVEVTTNLESCLKKLTIKPMDASDTKSDREFLLWVDALCINQNSVPERNNQIPKMKTIFSFAKEVIVWLGTEGKNTKVAIEYSKLIPSKMHDIEATTPDPNNRESYLEQEAVNMFQEQDSAVCRGWMELLESPWFQRLWPVQEWVLAKAVRFVCGDDILADEKFRSVILRALAHQIKQEDRFLKPWADKIFTRQRVERLRNLMQDRKSGQTRLQILLETFASRIATDPRDKIYGLLGIATDFQEGELLPDYGLPSCDVYMAAVKALLVKYDTLTILGQCYSGHNGLPTSQPTWVPPWEVNVSDNAYLEYPSPLEWEPYDDFETGPYHASGNIRLSTHPWHLNNKTRTLQLTGACVNIIARILDIECPHSIVEDPKSVARAWISLASELEPIYKFTSEKTTTALCRTMVADLVSTEQKVYRGDMPLLSENLPICVNDVTIEYEDVMTTFVTRIRNRKIAMTSDGWLGLVPACAEIGDRVAFFIGGPTLYVLRRWDQPTSVFVASRESTHFSLVGEAYFHGFMDGETLGLGELGEIVLH